LPRALCLLPDGPNYRRETFLTGLARAGFEVVDAIRRPEPTDIVLLWNRGGWRDQEALRFEAAGALAVIAENGYLGKQWQGSKWFALARGHHAGAGQWPDGGASRWDSWGVHLAPWRRGRDVVILEQRGIGEKGIASPPMWAETVQARIGGRIRRHPGATPPAVTLADDLADARCVVTWHSGAALQALVLGVPVFNGFDRWIGAGAARPLAEFAHAPRYDDSERLAMFRRLSWAMWTAEEVQSGEAFEHLVGR
jgi:hypothetical protein